MRGETRELTSHGMTHDGHSGEVESEVRFLQDFGEFLDNQVVHVVMLFPLFVGGIQVESCA